MQRSREIVERATFASIRTQMHGHNFLVSVIQILQKYRWIWCIGHILQNSAQTLLLMNQYHESMIQITYEDTEENVQLPNGQRISKRWEHSSDDLVSKWSSSDTQFRIYGFPSVHLDSTPRIDCEESSMMTDFRPNPHNKCGSIEDTCDCSLADLFEVLGICPTSCPSW